MYSRSIASRLTRLALAAMLACSSIVLWAATKGPDAGGYTATDEIVYSFVDISGASGAASVLSGTDDGAAALALPFAFQFYGTPYSFACVSTNGALYFMPSAGACSGFETDFANTDIAAAAVPLDKPAVLPFWTDLTFQVPGAGAIYYQTVGAAPNRRFVVQWENAFPQGAANPVTFQAILTETTNKAVFQYKTVALGGAEPAHNGAASTVGIRNTGAPGNNQGIEWSFNAPVLANNYAISFGTSISDTTPPTVTVLRPNDAGEKVFTGAPYTIEWSAFDNVALASFDVQYSTDSGATYAPVAGCTSLAGTVPVRARGRALAPRRRRDA